jgi:hypothetical protein
MKTIIFTGESVRAILIGEKTMTRRVLKNQPTGYVCGVNISENGYLTIYTSPAKQSYTYADSDGGKVSVRVGDYQSCIGQPGKYKVGDKLWVKEKTIIAPKRFAQPDETCIPDAEGDPRYVQYLATSPNTDGADDYKLKKTSSMFMPRWASRLTLEVTAVKVERVQDISEADAMAEGCESVADFKARWEAINGKKHPWASNPWCWCVSFKKVVTS